MSTIGWDFTGIFLRVVVIFLIFGYPLYALVTGKIISGSKEYYKEENPRIYWALIGLLVGVGIFVFLIFFI